MYVTDTSKHDPTKFSLSSAKVSYLFDEYDVFNDECSVPMQKYLIFLNNARVTECSENTLNVSISRNDENNKSTCEFIDTLENGIKMNLNASECSSNFAQCDKNVNILLTVTNVLIFDHDNIKQDSRKITNGNIITIVIKLARVIHDCGIIYPIWDAIQVKIHDDIERVCLFEQPTHQNIPNAPPLIMPKFNIANDKQKPKNDKPKGQTFVPTVSDIMSIKDKLRKVQVKQPKPELTESAHDLSDVSETMRDVISDEPRDEHKKSKHKKHKKSHSER